MEELRKKSWFDEVTWPWALVRLAAYSTTIQLKYEIDNFEMFTFFDEKKKRAQTQLFANRSKRKPNDSTRSKSRFHFFCDEQWKRARAVSIQ